MTDWFDLKITTNLNRIYFIFGKPGVENVMIEGDVILGYNINEYNVTVSS